MKIELKDTLPSKADYALVFEQALSKIGFNLVNKRKMIFSYKTLEGKLVLYLAPQRKKSEICLRPTIAIENYLLKDLFSEVDHPVKLVHSVGTFWLSANEDGEVAKRKDWENKRNRQSVWPDGRIRGN